MQSNNQTKTKEMTPAAYIHQATKLGLYRRNIGLSAIAELKALINDPIPSTPANSNWKTRHIKPSSGKHTGVLIASGLVRLSPTKTHYEATQDGITWVNELSKHNLT